MGLKVLHTVLLGCYSIIVGVYFDHLLESFV